jgi:hypothetical protein
MFPKFSMFLRNFLIWDLLLLLLVVARILDGNQQDNVFKQRCCNMIV